MKFNKLTVLLLVTVLVLSLFSGCRKIGGETSSNSSDVSSNVYNFDDNTESGNQFIESTIIEDNQNVESNDNSSIAGDSSQPDNTTDVDSGDSEDDIIPPVIEPTPDSTPSGDGTTSLDNSIPTYSAPLNARGTTKTKEIDPGKYHYYKIKGAANQVLTIESKNAYVKYNGVTYSPKNGVLSFLVESDLLASDYVLFEIGNKGSQKESFKIQFNGPLGSKDNPEPINIVGEKITKTTKEGNSQGYSYSYVATEAGKLRFYILSDTKKCKLDTLKIIGNNIPVSGTTDIELKYLPDETKYMITDKDDVGTYIEYKDVAVGDEIIITIGPISTSFPSVTVEWMIKYN